MRALVAVTAIALAALVLSAPPHRPVAGAGAAVISVDANRVDPGPQATGFAAVTEAEIAVDIDIQNADAIGAWESEVLYDPSYLVFLRWSPGAFLGSTGRSTSCQQVIQATTIHVGCGTPGTPSPPGPSGDGLLATVYFRPKAVGQTCLLMTDAATSDVLGNSLLTTGADACLTIVSGTQDTDGDGCTDAQELGTSHIYGGDRDPTNPWDFFDVPVPALNPADTSGHRDHSVAINDVIAILAYIGAAIGRGANGTGVLYTSDLDADGVADGREYDRTPSADPSKPWRSGPPDGAVTIKDAMVELNQVGDRCLP